MEPLIIIAGPTAVGKSDLAVKLAKRINGEIISADSMQVYKGMDIGSAKITLDEMQGIKHYLISELEPKDEFNVAVFKEKASQYVSEIVNKGKIPILTGGTGFYIQALLYGIDFSKSKGESIKFRACLQERIDKEGIDSVYNELIEVDPEAAKTIHKNNVKRVIRALEFYHETGMPISLHNEEQRKNEAIYNAAYFVLNDERERVYKRIDSRVDKMEKAGLVEEVKKLKNAGYDRSYVSMQGLGYKEILAYLDGEIDLERALYLIKRDSRHFAKKQITWFNREPEVIWLNKYEFDYNDELILQKMIFECKDRKII